MILWYFKHGFGALRKIWCTTRFYEMVFAL